MKTKVVLFDKHTCRILINPKPEDYEGHPNYLVNPDCSQVEGLPPHAWSLEDGKIVPASAKEAAGRLEVLHAQALPIAPPPAPEPEANPAESLPPKTWHKAYLVAGALLANVGISVGVFFVLRYLIK